MLTMNRLRHLWTPATENRTARPPHFRRLPSHRCRRRPRRACRRRRCCRRRRLARQRRNRRPFNRFLRRRHSRRPSRRCERSLRRSPAPPPRRKSTFSPRACRCCPNWTRPRSPNCARASTTCSLAAVLDRRQSWPPHQPQLRSRRNRSLCRRRLAWPSTLVRLPRRPVDRPCMARHRLPSGPRPIARAEQVAAASSTFSIRPRSRRATCRRTTRLRRARCPHRGSTDQRGISWACV